MKMLLTFNLNSLYDANKVIMPLCLFTPLHYFTFGQVLRAYFELLSTDAKNNSHTHLLLGISPNVRL